MTTPLPPNDETAKAEVITSIRLVGDPIWTAVFLQEPVTARAVILIQDTLLNVGIIGTAEQLNTMADRIKEACVQPVNAQSVLSKIGASLDGNKDG